MYLTVIYITLSKDKGVSHSSFKSIQSCVFKQAMYTGKSTIAFC